MPFSDPRQEALGVLNALAGGRGGTLDRILADTGNGRTLSEKDRALFNAIVFGVLRWRNRLDWIVRRFSKTPFDKIDQTVLNILRMGLFQMVILDRVPVSAAVNTSVELSKSVAAHWVSRFVNAVLRNADRSMEALVWPAAETDPVAYISVTKSVPAWMARRWIDRFGLTEAGDLCDALNQIPTITVRTNSLKTTRSALLSALAIEADHVEPTLLSPDGIRLTGPGSAVDRLRAFSKGWFQVQDEAAQLVGHLLAPRPGERILDACAGIGGKTGHIAQLMNNNGEVIALDRDASRLAGIDPEMKRLGIGCVSTCRDDLADPDMIGRLDAFDRVLVDAPCSGLGVLRRNPDAKWSGRKRDLNRYRKRQVVLLERAAALVAGGGVLVYAVCSIEPEENEQVVERFLDSRTDFTIEGPEKDLSGLMDWPLDRHGCLKTYPHRHDMDGFFAVRFRRR